MRHGKKVNHLSRKSAHRKAMLSNMACSLIEHKRIHTTLAKAKALRVYVEPLVTKSKTDSTHSRRVVFSYLQSKDATAELFREVAPKVADRPGGYTRIIKTGPRLGDNAEMAYIELVDFNEIYTTEKKAKKSRRRRGGSGKKQATEAVADVAETTEAKAEEAVDASTEASAKVEETKEVATDAVEATTEAAAEDAPATEEAAPEAEAKDEAADDAGEAKEGDAEGDAEEKAE